MAKGQKSSASSATRKKHAKKAAGGEQLLPLPKEKKDKSGKKGKGKHAEPRQKIFIPPSKPAPVRPDPLTNSAIASKLPPELLVVLKRIAKKDPTTRQKALEELNTNWLARITSDSEIALTVALPVWVCLLQILLDYHFDHSQYILASSCPNAILKRRTKDPFTRHTISLLMVEERRSSIASRTIIARWSASFPSLCDDWRVAHDCRRD